MTNYNKMIEVLNKPQTDDEDIFKKSLKYILKFSSKPNKIYHISSTIFLCLVELQDYFLRQVTE